jgi:hypothetical protein
MEVGFHLTHFLAADDREVTGEVNQDVQVPGSVADELRDAIAVSLVGGVRRRVDDIRVGGPTGPPGVQNPLGGYRAR